MNIPSLVGERSVAVSGQKLSYVPENVFVDIGINKMISDNMMEFLSQPQSEKNIILRQNVFREVLDAGGGCYEILALLAEYLAEIIHAADRIKRAEEEIEKDVLFVALSAKVKSYITMSASMEKFGKAELISEFQRYFQSVTESDAFKSFASELAEIEEALLDINCNTMRVMANGKIFITQKGNRGTDMLSKLQKYAADLKIDDLPEYARQKRVIPTSVLIAAAGMYPAVFMKLRGFRTEYAEFVTGDMKRCLKECEFYIEGKKLADKFRERGIKMCFPKVAQTPMFSAKNVYDISLLSAGHKIIPNDAEFDEKDHFYFLTGANGGGKTTYIRTVGIAVLFFLSGCFVPCESAEMYPFKRVFTHFPKDERFSGSGRLVEEEARATEMMSQSDGETFALFNETFSGTDEVKSAQMTESLGRECVGKGVFGVYVTHIHGIADTGIPILNVIVDTDDDNRRTFRVVRRDSVRSSFAHDILKKYGLTSEQLLAKSSPTGEENRTESGSAAI